MPKSKLRKDHKKRKQKRIERLRHRQNVATAEFLRKQAEIMEMFKQEQEKLKDEQGEEE